MGTFFCSLPDFEPKLGHLRTGGLFFALYLILSGNWNICAFCGRDDPFYFALPISAAFSFKTFRNAALRSKSLPTLGIHDQYKAVCSRAIHTVLCCLNGMKHHFRTSIVERNYMKKGFQVCNSPVMLTAYSSIHLRVGPLKRDVSLSN